jgi:hypothetical protein
VKYRLLYCLLIFLGFSCNKGGGAEEQPHSYFDPGDSSYPVVTINTPTDNQVFSSGSVIDVTGTVSDNSLFQGSISIRNDANGLVVKDQAYEIHYIPSYNFSMSCPITVTAPTEFTVSVKFEDHGYNITAKTIKIKVNP